MTLRNTILAGVLACAAGMAAFAEDTPPGDTGDTAAQGVTGEENQAAPNDAQAQAESAASEAASAEKDKKKTNAELVMEMQNAGYKIVNESGTQMFCRTDDILGSRLRKKTRCLTAAEAEQERQAASDALADMSRKSYIPPSE